MRPKADANRQRYHACAHPTTFMYVCVAAALCCAPLFSSFLPHATLQCLLAAVLKGNRWYFVTMLSLVVVAADVVSGL